MPDPPGPPPHHTLDRGGRRTRAPPLPPFARRAVGRPRRVDHKGRGELAPEFEAAGIRQGSSTGARSRAAAGRPPHDLFKADVPRAARRGKRPAARARLDEAQRGPLPRRTSSAPRRGGRSRRAARRRTRSSDLDGVARFFRETLGGPSPRCRSSPRTARRAPSGARKPLPFSAPAAECGRRGALAVRRRLDAQKDPATPRPPMPRVTAAQVARSSSRPGRGGHLRAHAARLRDRRGLRGIPDDPAPAFAPPTSWRSPRSGKAWPRARRGGAVREPVVATRVGGIPRSSSTERPGLLVPPSDAVRRRRSRPRREIPARTDGEAARRRAETHFSWRGTPRCREPVFAAPPKAGAMRSWWVAGPASVAWGVLEAMFRVLPQRRIEGTAVAVGPGSTRCSTWRRSTLGRSCASTCAAR